MPLLSCLPLTGFAVPEGVPVTDSDHACPGCTGEPEFPIAARTATKPPGDVWTYPFFPQAGLL